MPKLSKTLSIIVVSTLAMSSWTTPVQAGFIGRAITGDFCRMHPISCRLAGAGTAAATAKALADAYQARQYDEHTKGARPSTKGRHEKGQTRRDQDYGKEKGDDYRNLPRKAPNGWRGPYPPKRK